MMVTPLKLPFIHKESIEDTILEENGSYENLDDIDIMSDARHGWRENAEDSNVSAFGDQTKKSTTLLPHYQKG